MNILLAEDNPVNQEIAVGLLESLDCTVTVVENGKDAVDAATHKAFDLVLMDCQMPIVDGFEATRQLRQRFSPEQLPILAMTANALAGDRERVLHVGMQDHIAKPVDPAELFDTIESWVNALNLLADDPIHLPDQSVHPPDELEPHDPVLDYQAGLGRVGGNVELFTQICLRFLGEQETLFDRINAAVDCGEGDSALLLAHTLKGTAATLGASEIATTAADWEERFGRGLAAAQWSPAAERHLFSEQMDRLVERLAPHGILRGPPPEDTGDLERFDRAEHAQPLRELDQLLDDGDTAAIALVNKLTSLDGGADPDLAEIAQLILAYDFMSARQRLRAWTGAQ